MFHRWGSLPSYQRTRGALQFLATVVHALWAGRAEREPQALIGPGDVDLADEGTRMTFLEQVGETDQYRSVVEADFLAADAGTRRVDERLGRDAPGSSGCVSGRASRPRSCCCRSARARARIAARSSAR